MTTQIIVPNPDIACRPGYCLEYVRETFALPIRYGSATEAWNMSASQHRDWNFPAGLWVPIYFSIDIEPNGHIALLTPDGSVYSSSDLTNTPHHHPSIDDLIAYYLRWGKMTLTFLGWSEDVAGYPVVSVDASINFQSTPTPQEDDMPLSDDDVLRVAKATVAILMTEQHGGNTLGELIAEERQHYLDVLHASTNPKIDVNQAEDIVRAVVNRAPNAFLNAKLPLTSGQSASVAWVLDALNNKPAATGIVTNVPTDPAAIVDAIVNGVNIQIVKK